MASEEELGCVKLFMSSNIIMMDTQICEVGETLDALNIQS